MGDARRGRMEHPAIRRSRDGSLLWGNFNLRFQSCRGPAGTPLRPGRALSHSRPRSGSRWGALASGSPSAEGRRASGMPMRARLGLLASSPATCRARGRPVPCELEGSNADGCAVRDVGVDLEPARGRLHLGRGVGRTAVTDLLSVTYPSDFPAFERLSGPGVGHGSVRLVHALEVAEPRGMLLLP